jgi:uncharacterized protein (DUF2062 family)
MKKFFKQSLPPVAQIKSHPRLQFLGTLLHDPNLWHFNRRSLSGATAVGLFCAFIPMPMQMLSAAILAICFRVNLVLASSLVWITNPITIPAFFYICYKVGSFLLGMPDQRLEFQFSQEWFLEILGTFWQPLLLGCLVMGTLSAITGYLLVNAIWRLHVGHVWQNRCKTRLRKKVLLTKKPAPLEKLPE